MLRIYVITSFNKLSEWYFIQFYQIPFFYPVFLIIMNISFYIIFLVQSAYKHNRYGVVRTLWHYDAYYSSHRETY